MGLLGRRAFFCGLVVFGLALSTLAADEVPVSVAGVWEGGYGRDASVILRLEQDGASVRGVFDIKLNLCNEPFGALTPRSVRELALVPDVNVTAVFKASAAHLIPYR